MMLFSQLAVAGLIGATVVALAVRPVLWWIERPRGSHRTARRRRRSAR